ncbi:hypothetical protein [Pseudoxanthomonas mexicana]|uniref:hypothetical protein n=1 Tax=Pseudoxanthomonas mexicana TaxID=128785 RepID=UPI0012EE2112|nr:hypothetical protein [Pseudoxanthomonas mexicana]
MNPNIVATKRPPVGLRKLTPTYGIDASFTQGAVRMKTIAIALTLAGLLYALPGSATSLCFDPPAAMRFDGSNVVVVATVIAKSVEQEGGAWRQAIR